MRRRTFVKSLGMLAAAVAAKRVEAAPQSAFVGGRMILQTNRGWRYSPSSLPEFHKPEFDDSKFVKVNLPHTNIMLPWHGFNDKDYEFISTYRRRVNVPAAAKGKRVFVDFEGATTASTVWFNGHRLGEYRGGYTPFSFEVTDHVNASGSNLVSVSLDSTERADIPPFGNEIDYLTFGGIYREVALRVVPQISVANIQAIPTEVLSGQPSVEVRIYLDRPTGVSPEKFSVSV